jgi:UDP-hydrolysing UDP-N-acetyl-D-glucosamine 2-epimerase
MPRRKICVVLVDRANYGRLRPVMRAIKAHPNLDLQVITAGTMVLERFQKPEDIVRQDGFNVDGQIYIELEGSTPTTMAKSIGFGIVEFASEFQRLKPEIVLVIGDRYQALAATIAATFMNICVAHIQGGEVSGSIDESARHAITKLAHFHFPSTERSKEYLIRMGEDPNTILSVGCPSIDIAREIAPNAGALTSIVNAGGSGNIVDTAQPFLLVLFHPTTTEYGEHRQIEELLAALNNLKIKTIMMWPNIDAGADHISKAIRVFRDKKRPDWLRFLTNLPPDEFLGVLSMAACAVGNSSSFVRDASYFGTPVVLVGTRQQGREVDEHVLSVSADAEDIIVAVRKQLAHGKYPSSRLYGDGHVSEKIARGLADLHPYVQKRLHYLDCPDSWSEQRSTKIHHQNEGNESAKLSQLLTE